MPEPATISSSLQKVLEVITTGALSGLAGWWAKHFKDRRRGGDIPRVTVRQVADLHHAIIDPDPDLKLNHVQQTALVARYMSETDRDGNRVSWVRKVMESLAESDHRQTELLEKMDGRLDRLEQTWGGHRKER